MKVKQFYSTGNYDMMETEYEVPELGLNEVRVKTLYTGVCFSDISWFKGNFPIFNYQKDFFGHEGLGEVIAVGKYARGVEVGDLVATWRSSPAFAEVYNSSSYVKVPEASPKYIAEPLACGINVAMVAEDNLDLGRAILICGTGFLATVVYKYLKEEGRLDNSPVFVVGKANATFWDNENVTRFNDIDSIPNNLIFENVIDLSDKPGYLTGDFVGINPIYIYAANKSQPTDLGQLLDKGATMIMPSPSSERFRQAMEMAASEEAMSLFNSEGDIDNLWTNQYNATLDDVKRAFTDDYTQAQGRRYIKW